MVAELLAAAHSRGQDGYVAQHLVGAKLALRYRDQPEIEVANFAAAASDAQSGRSGDFQIGDTAFHVTTAPSEQNVTRCHENLVTGLGTYLLVPDAKLALARGLIDQAGFANSVTVDAIETFVGQNVAELGTFSREGVQRELALLLATYNNRVAAVETDRSLMIEIPSTLTRLTE